jgi:hypothetical protein
MVRRRSSDPSRRRKPLARDGLRAETLGWEHLARHQPARRPQFVDCRGVRVRPALGFARLRIAGQVAARSLCLGRTGVRGNRA